MKDFNEQLNAELGRIERDQAPYLANEFLPESVEHPDHPARIADRQRAYREGFLFGARWAQETLREGDK